MDLRSSYVRVAQKLLPSVEDRESTAVFAGSFIDGRSMGFLSSPCLRDQAVAYSFKAGTGVECVTFILKEGLAKGYEVR